MKAFAKQLESVSRDELHAAAHSLMGNLGREVAGGNYAGTALCYAEPLVDVLREIAKRKQAGVRPGRSAGK